MTKNTKMRLLRFAFNRKRFPFDWKNPIGYTAAYGIECAMGGQEFLLSSCLACLGVVAFLLGMAMTKDLRNILFTIQKNNKAKRNRSHGVKKLYQFIEFHSIPKQLSFEEII